MHYQSPPFAQAKLVKCIQGGIIDIIVDVRVQSSTFGNHIRVELNSRNHQQLYVPEGFLHGFCTTEDNTLVIYKVNNPYSPESEGAVMWNSPTLDLNWGSENIDYTLSNKDAKAVFFKDWKSPF